MAGHVSLHPTTVFADIAQSVAGSDTIIAGVAGKRICVMNYAVILVGDGTFQFKSGTDARSGAIPTLGSGGGNPASSDKRFPLFVTDPGDDLVLESVGAAARGHLTAYLDG